MAKKRKVKMKLAESGHVKSETGQTRIRSIRGL